MKVLLDECIDVRLAPQLSAFSVWTVSGRGWAGITNGELLALAQAEFDVMVTVDRNLAFQQQPPKFAIAVVLLHARTNRLADLVELVPALVEAIPQAPKGSLTRVGG